MACEKYSGWMIEAALDALSPQRYGEFSAHIAECRACREELERARGPSSAIERGIAALVATEPSPHFEAKLRARLAAERTPQRAWRFAWAPAGALAAVLITAVALLAIRVGQTRRNSSAASLASSAATLDASKTQPASVNPDTQRSPRSDSGEIVSESDPASATATATRPQRLNATPHVERAKLGPSHQQQPEVLVPPGQFAMIERYALAARGDRIDTAQVAKAVQHDDGAPSEPNEIDEVHAAAPLEVKAIDIAPLKIQELPGGADSDSTDSPSDSSGKS